MKTSRISVCIATYDEAHNITRCLESVYSWADEIILVDGHSTDDTVQIAKAFGSKVKVHLESNPAMFHINKEKAIEKATGEWIFQIDADEEVSPELKKEILDLVQNPGEFAAYWMPRLNYFLGKPLHKGGQYPDYTIRLYKNGSAYFPCKSVHEQVTVKGETGYLKNNLLHYPYPNFSEYIKKWDRYSGLEAELLHKKHMKLSWFNCVSYCILQPKQWFFLTYFRHKAFMDGFPGFIFSLFSGLRFVLIYVKLYEKIHSQRSR